MAFRWRTVARLEAGQRDRLIEIQQRPVADVADADSGEPVETWSTLVARLPAARTDIQGYERVRVTHLASASDVRWEINYRRDMDPELLDVPKTRRLLVADRVHDIVAASILGRKRGIELWTIASTQVPA